MTERRPAVPALAARARTIATRGGQAAVFRSDTTADRVAGTGRLRDRAARPVLPLRGPLAAAPGPGPPGRGRDADPVAADRVARRPRAAAGAGPVRATAAGGAGDRRS